MKMLISIFSFVWASVTSTSSSSGLSDFNVYISLNFYTCFWKEEVSGGCEREMGGQWEMSSSSLSQGKCGCRDLTLPGESFCRLVSAVGGGSGLEADS